MTATAPGSPLAAVAFLLLSACDIDASTDYLEQTHVYKRLGEDSLRVNVVRPADDVVRPLVFWLHGGGLITEGLKHSRRRREGSTSKRATLSSR